MKRILKSIGIVAIAIGTLSMPYACDVEEDCSMNARAMMQCNLFQIDEETNEKNSIALTTLTITAFGTDSVIINKESNVSKLSLPLRFSADSTVLVFHYQLEPSDTIVVRHYNTPYFLSMDCGYQMKQSIKSVSYTRHQLDSIYIANKEANIYGTENLKLFY